MLSKKTHYALKALLLLVKQFEMGQQPALISDLAKEGKIPKKFLESILLELKRAGVLVSRPGKGGGYMLNRPPDQVAVGSIIRYFEGPLALLPCASVTAYKSCELCSNEESCGLKRLFLSVRDATAGILDKATLQQVRDLEKKYEKNSLHRDMYYI